MSKVYEIKANKDAVGNEKLKTLIPEFKNL